MSTTITLEQRSNTIEGKVDAMGLRIVPDQVLKLGGGGLRSFGPLYDPNIVVLDTFVAANGTDLNGRTPAPVNTASTVWTRAAFTAGQNTSFAIQSNKVLTSNPVYANICTVNSGISDGTILCTVKAVNTTSQAGIVFRAIDTDNLFWMFIFNNFFRVSRKVAGVGADLITSNPTLPYNVAYPIKIVLAGTSIKVYVDGTLRADLTDANHQTATKHGLYTNTTPCEYADFEVMR